MEHEKESTKVNEILGVVLLGVAALCAVGVYFGGEGEGAFVQYLRDFIFGLTGILGYVVPVILAGFGVLLIAARGRVVNRGKQTLLFLCVLFVFSMVHLGVADRITVPGQTYGGFLADSYTIGAADTAGGGLLGALLSYWTYTYLGLAGSWIVFLVAVAACVLALTNLSLRRISEDIGGAVRSGIEERRARAAEAGQDSSAHTVRETRAARSPAGGRPRPAVSDSNPFDLRIQSRDPKRRLGGRRKTASEPVLEPAFQARRKRVDAGNVIDIRTHAAKEKPAHGGTGLENVVVGEEYNPEPYREVFADTDIEFQDAPVIELRSRRRLDPSLAAAFGDQTPDARNSVLDLRPDPHPEPAADQAPAGQPSQETPDEKELFSGIGDHGGTLPPWEEELPEVHKQRSGAPALPDVSPSHGYHVETGQDRAGTAAVLAADEDPGSISSPASGAFQLPPLELLERQALSRTHGPGEDLQGNAARLEDTLRSFRIEAQVVDILQGPVVTRYELKIAPGIPVKRVEALSNDLAMNLEASSIRIEAPVPGKAVIGVEIPNKEREMVGLRELLEDSRAKKTSSPIAFALGKDITGTPVYADIAKMPHLLVAGQTGSGKSVCLNSLIVSVLLRATPDDVKLLMIDPKQVELSGYNAIPHLVAPVVTDAKKAPLALNWAVNEMNQRYKLFQQREKRELKSYNAILEAEGEKKLPQILVIVDELAELMLSNARKEVEEAIQRIAQLGRAAGIHLVIATQRPIVDVISGLIKANVPARIAFSVKSALDSRTILDVGGAESLLGRGDMLFYTTGLSAPERIQGCHVSDPEIERVVSFLRQEAANMEQNHVDFNDAGTGEASAEPEEDRDPLFEEAVRLAVENEGASTSFLQRRLRIGYGRAARLVDQMEQEGIVAGQNGSKAREILISREEYERLYRTDTD